MTNTTQKKEKNGYIPGKIGSRPERQERLLNSEKLSKDSKKRWRTPRDARELAQQANEVATMILNQEIDLEVATKYTAAARTTSQLLSIEVYRARVEKTKANISLEP